MQDRYSGDVGDFMKLGVLRAIAGNPDEPRLRVGVNWYLVDDEGHNNDGKHIAYLDAPGRTARTLRACDPDLIDRLRAVVTGSTTRSVAALEHSGALPPDVTTYLVRVPRGRRASQRDTWHADALNALAAADVVFCDPDNGVRAATAPPTRTDHKHAFTDELRAYWDQGQSLVVYHHADRSAPASVQIHRLLSALRDAGIPADSALRCRRGSTRFLLIAAAPRHHDLLTRRLAAIGTTWKPHIELLRQPRTGER